MTKRWWYAVYRDDEDTPVMEGEVRAENRADAERLVLRHVPDEDHGMLIQEIIDESLPSPVARS